VGDLGHDRPGSGHNENHLRPVTVPLQVGIHFVIHRDHPGHGRHVVVDQDLRVFHNLSRAVLDFHLNLVVAEDRRVLVDPDDESRGEGRKPS
jgi:hypothetical protein